MELSHHMIGLSSILLDIDKLLFKEVYQFILFILYYTMLVFHTFSLIVGRGRFYFFSNLT